MVPVISLLLHILRRIQNSGLVNLYVFKSDPNQYFGGGGREIAVFTRSSLQDDDIVFVLTTADVAHHN